MSNIYNFLVSEEIPATVTCPVLLSGHTWSLGDYRQGHLIKRVFIRNGCVESFHHDS